MTLGAPDDGTLLITVADRVAVLTLNRPEVRNALTPALSARLRDAVARLETDDSVDVLVLTGADPAFSAGVDLKAVAEGAELAPQPGRGPFGPRRKLLIGAVNGPAVTGGLELALNCDLLIASERARFADTHARVGVQPGWGMTVLLSRAVGVARARQMSATGGYIDARTAERWGLVNEVVRHERLLERCGELARACSSIDQRSVRRILRTYAEGFDTTADEAWRIEDEANRDWLEQAGNTAELGRRHKAATEHGRSQMRADRDT